jgi:hypothetical protein
MSNIIRAIGYTGLTQRMVMPAGFAANITVHAWGGGGGGSGGDSNGYRPGGNGGGSGYSQVSLSVNPGDVLDIAVGEGGGVGGGAYQGGPGSAGGQSYTLTNSSPTNGGAAQVAPIPTVPFQYGFPSGNGFYTRTQNDDSNPYSGAILQWWVIINGAMVWTSSWGGRSPLYIPGTYRGSATGYYWTYSGRRNNFGTNYDEINAFDLNYYSGTSYCGGHGGISQEPFYSGAGGGGGGATVILLNGSIVGYAGGGGGGGGCGNQCGSGYNAPGPNGQSGSSRAGSAGQSAGVGGGGGGGAGGNGGAGEASEGLAQAGAYGINFGNYSELPNATTPGGTGNGYYPAGVGTGGQGQDPYNGGGQPGGPGYAVVEMQSKSFQIKDAGIWKPVNNSFIKHGYWQQIKATYVKQNGTWTPVIGTSDAYAPRFNSLSVYFGALPRGYGGEEIAPPPPPPVPPLIPPPPDYGTGSSDMF